MVSRLACCARVCPRENLTTERRELHGTCCVIIIINQVFIRRNIVGKTRVEADSQPLQRHKGTRSSAITKSPHWSSAWHVEGPPRTSVETHPRASLESAPALCGVTETLQRPILRSRQSTNSQLQRRNLLKKNYKK